MTEPEFSHIVDVRRIDGRTEHLSADAGERAELAKRFGLVRIDRLDAELRLERTGAVVAATGRLNASFVQSCAVSGDDLPVDVSEPLEFRFVPAAETQPDEEIELGAENLDEIEYDGERIDLGEAVAQSLALAIDPFAVGPEAERVRQEAGLMEPEDAGPFAALKALKKD